MSTSSANYDSMGEGRNTVPTLPLGDRSKSTRVHLTLSHPSLYGDKLACLYHDNVAVDAQWRISYPNGNGWAQAAAMIAMPGGFPHL